MKCFNYVVVVVTLLLSYQHVLAKAARIPLPEKVAQSHLIARVEVLSIGKNAAKGTYVSLAKIKIIQSLKGQSDGKVVDLEFDNGIGCPNVLYARGEECLIFATLLENGRYYTYNTYYGKFEIKNDRIAWWEDSGKDGTTWNEVAAQIKKHTQKTKPKQQIKSQ